MRESLYETNANSRLYAMSGYQIWLLSRDHIIKLALEILIISTSVTLSTCMRDFGSSSLRDNAKGFMLVNVHVEQYQPH